MIKLDFNLAIAIYLSSTLLLVFIHWIFYNFKNNGDPWFDLKDLQQCPYCTLVFCNFKPSDCQICPKCKSYFITSEFQKRNSDSPLLSDESKRGGQDRPARKFRCDPRACFAKQSYGTRREDSTERSEAYLENKES